MPQISSRKPPALVANLDPGAAHEITCGPYPAFAEAINPPPKTG